MKSIIYLLLALNINCAPNSPIKPAHPPSDKRFVVIIKNNDSATNTFRVRTAISGQYYYDNEFRVPSKADGVFITGTIEPDLVEVYTTAWATAFGTSDYKGHSVLHFDIYPIPFMEAKDF